MQYMPQLQNQTLDATKFSPDRGFNHHAFGYAHTFHPIKPKYSHRTSNSSEIIPRTPINFRHERKAHIQSTYGYSRTHCNSAIKPWYIIYCIYFSPKTTVSCKWLFPFFHYILMKTNVLGVLIQYLFS